MASPLAPTRGAVTGYSESLQQWRSKGFHRTHLQSVPTHSGKVQGKQCKRHRQQQDKATASAPRTPTQQSSHPRKFLISFRTSRDQLSKTRVMGITLYLYIYIQSCVYIYIYVCVQQCIPGVNDPFQIFCYPLTNKHTRVMFNYYILLVVDIPAPTI